MSATEATTHRPPRQCPVCASRLTVTRLGCTQCGTEVSGAFVSSPYASLNDDELEMLRVFLVSRGNMRELERHLGVSYPTARQRFADLLTTLGFHERSDEDLGRERVLEDLAGGRISVDEAEALLS